MVNLSFSPFLIINPGSGGGKGQALINKLKSQIDHQDIAIKYHDITFAPLNTCFEEIRNSSCILIAGGDGTVSKVVSELSAFKLPIGIIPLGTGNDLARTLGVTKKFDFLDLKALMSFFEKAATVELQTWDLFYGAELKEKVTFCNYASFGFDGTVIRKFDRLRNSPFYFADRFGRYGNRAAYVALSLVNTFSHRRFNIVIKRASEKGEFKAQNIRTLLFANIRAVVGVGESNLISNPADNLIELLLLKNYSQYLPYVFGHKFMECGPSLIGSESEWQIEFPEPSEGQIDGEPFTATGNTIRISPGHQQSFLSPLRAGGVWS